MTTPPEDEPTTLTDAWKDRAEAAELARRFPGVAVWFGAATRRWWALVPSAGRWRLVEAGDPRDLSHLINSANAASSHSGNARPLITRAVHAPARRPRSPEPRRRSPGRHSRA